MPHPPLEELNRLHANLCQAVADPKRILIIYALHDHPRNVSTLAADLEIPQPTVSRHLRVLRDPVFANARGYWRFAQRIGA